MRPSFRRIKENTICFYLGLSLSTLATAWYLSAGIYLPENPRGRLERYLALTICPIPTPNLAPTPTRSSFTAHHGARRPKWSALF